MMDTSVTAGNHPPQAGSFMFRSVAESLSEVGPATCLIGLTSQKHGRARLAQEERIMLMIILVVLLVAALAGGGLGHSRFGYAGWSPAGLVVVVLLLLYFTGYLHR